MKSIVTFIAVLALSINLFAQKVDVNKQDKITVDGTEVAILKKTVGNAGKAEFSVQTLDGEEVAIAKVSNDYVPVPVNSKSTDEPTHYVHITFMGSGNQSSMEYSVNFKKNLAKEFVKCKMFTDSATYNPAGEKKFMILNPYKGNIIYANGGNTIIVNNDGANNGPNYTTVQRNRSGMVQIFGSQIQQDFKQIGTVQSGSRAIGGNIVKTYSFYLPNGTQVAEATVEGIGSNTVTIITTKDNQTYTITVSSGTQIEEDIAKYLISKFYL